jgi:hypothetical protein
VLLLQLWQVSVRQGPDGGGPGFELAKTTASHGVKVVSVDKGGAADGGVRVGDVISLVNGKSVIGMPHEQLQTIVNVSAQLDLTLLRRKDSQVVIALGALCHYSRLIVVPLIPLVTPIPLVWLVSPFLFFFFLVFHPFHPLLKPHRFMCREPEFIQHTFAHHGVSLCPILHCTSFKSSQSKSVCFEVVGFAKLEGHFCTIIS